MKTIESPNAWQLALIMLPAPILGAVALIIHRIPEWFYVVGIACIAIYLVALTYLCIKQKCYTQLFQTWIAVAVWGGYILVRNLLL